MVLLKVAVIINSSEKGDGPCVKAIDGSRVSTTRPGAAAAAAKKYGPFACVAETSAGLFDTLGIAGSIETSLREGTSYGLITFGPAGQGKTTAMWGSPALGKDRFIALKRVLIV